jgi:hypothetical protein
VTALPTSLPHDAHQHGHEHRHAPVEGGLPQRLRGDNINFPQGAGGGISMALMVLGVLLVAGGLAAAFSGAGGVSLKHGIAAYLVGAFTVLAICIGATFFVMVNYLVNSGWTSTIRRQVENIMAFLPYAWLLLLPALAIEIAKGGVLFTWMNKENATDYLLNKKATYFFFPLHVGEFPAFFVVRTLFYGLFWWFITSSLIRLSKEQDRTGDRWLTAKAVRLCSWGLPVFALTIAFSGFDYLMSPDFKFFSTMWGVYFFAGAVFSAIATITLVINVLLRKGKLKGCVSEEHFHDLGKFQFAFTVFWAYIGFSQYFLIYYANIPEETAFYNHRNAFGWDKLGILLMVGHFIAPFFILLSRHVKKHFNLMIPISLWCIAMQVADMFWILRPMAYTPTPLKDANGVLIAVQEATSVGPGLAGGYLDALLIFGMLAIFAGYLIRKVASGPLVAVNDPRIHEAVGHKNYV